MKSPPTILVTGGTGFLGSHLVDGLVARGDTVRVLIRSSSSLKYIRPHMHSGYVEVVQGDLTDAGSLESACEGVQIVFNCAAVVDFQSTKNQLEAVNVSGLASLTKAALKHHVQRLIHVSSAGLYGWEKGVIHEGWDVRPDNEYERTKAQGEGILLQTHREKGLPVVILQPSFIYGPRARIGMRELFRYAGNPWLPLVDGGKHRLNMVYVSDVVDVLIRSADIETAVGQRFIIGHLDNPTYREIVKTAAELMGVSTARWSLPYGFVKPMASLLQKWGGTLAQHSIPYSDYLDYMVRDGVMDISKAERILGFVPKVSLDEGMLRTVTWFRQNTDLIQKNRPQRARSRHREHEA